jgi:hypothetical protein
MIQTNDKLNHDFEYRMVYAKTVSGHFGCRTFMNMVLENGKAVAAH